MPGHLIEPAASSAQLRRRWTPVNSLKNSSVTIVIHCSWSGQRYPVPAKAPSEECEEANYFDESPAEDVLLGSTTLFDLIQKVKAKIPALYLWEEVGGQVLVCGNNQVFASEWETTMLCHLIRDVVVDPTCVSGANGAVPKVILEDGREAVVVTIGTPESVRNAKASVVTRCLAKGDVYG